ncbi:hypothetical protein CBS101457_006415 [Exobasidium rhododendri]|nr:hypothetical protein CBS101457_006415 [Exobasidium rhododendri]
MTSAPSRGQLLKLYRSYLATSQTFSSYNFRTYFLRRSRDMFRSNLLPAAQSNVNSSISKASHGTVAASPSTLLSPEPSILSQTSISSQGASEAERLQIFYQTAKKDLDVLRRAALTNRMYEGEKLVVEKPRLILGGGGAGAESSTGGSGQPRSSEQSPGGAPASALGDSPTKN